MRAIYRKEMRQYWVSPSGVVFLAAYAALTGYCFSVGNLYAQNGRAAVLFGTLLPMLMYLIPVITMRLFAEERKLRTEQLLFTAPLAVRDVVLGKFLAAFTMFAIGSLPVLLCVALLARYGCFQGLEVLGNLAGLLLTGMAFISIGLFASSITENQIVSAVVSYAILLGLWLLGYFQSYVSDPFFLGVIRLLSYQQHFQELSTGIFSLTAAVYFVGMTLWMLQMTITVLECRRH